MPSFSLVISSPRLTGGTEVIKVFGESEAAVVEAFAQNQDNAGAEILHVIEHETPPVEVVIDYTDGIMQQVISNHPNTSVVILNASRNGISSDLENCNGTRSGFAPDIDVDGDPKAPWAFRALLAEDVDINPRLTRHYLSHASNPQAILAFNAAVYKALGG